MNCCLWLNGNKVKNASEIKDNFDLASLRGYFLGGSLIRWLEYNGGEVIAKRLSDISVNDEINKGIEHAFGVLSSDTADERKIAKKKKTSCNKGEVSSFNFNSLRQSSRSREFSSGYYGSFSSYGSFGSFRNFNPFDFQRYYKNTPHSLCLLNKYGYGIHLISKAKIKK